MTKRKPHPPGDEEVGSEDHSMPSKTTLAAPTAQAQAASVAVIPLRGEFDAVRLVRRGSRLDVRVWTYPRGGAEPVATPRGMTLCEWEVRRLVRGLQGWLQSNGGQAK